MKTPYDRLLDIHCEVCDERTALQGDLIEARHGLHDANNQITGLTLAIDAIHDVIVRTRDPWPVDGGLDHRRALAEIAAIVADVRRADIRPGVVGVKP